MQAHHNGSAFRGSGARGAVRLLGPPGAKAGGRLPGRRSIHPADFKRHLPTVSLIDVRHEPTRDYRLRLAGTGLYGVYGREITGLRLEDVYDEVSADYWRGQLDAVVEDTNAPPSASIRSPGAVRRTCLCSGCGCRWRATAATST